MRTTTSSNRSGRGQRGAFTLVELLVVITIIAALMALTSSAVLKFIVVQQTSNTQSTLDRVQSQLARAWSKVKDSAKNETAPATVVALAGADANATGRAKVIYIKLKARQAFPMNFAEALNVQYQNPELAAWGLPTLIPQSPLPALPGYVSYLASLGIKPVALGGTIGGPGYVPQPYESAICLLMALQRGVSGAGIDPSDLTAGGAAGTINSNSNPTLLSAWGPNVTVTFLADAWGRPVFFSRFPAGSPILNPAGALPGANDPGDPQGYLNSPYWYTLAAQQTTFSQLTLQFLAPKSNPPLSYKLAPMVASGGPSDWSNRGTTPTPASSFNPITFAPVLGSDALYSTP